MRGCFRAIFAADNDKFWDFNIQAYPTQGIFIPFKRILRIHKFDTSISHINNSLFKQRIRDDSVGWNVDYHMHAYYLVLFEIIDKYDPEKKFKRCTCAMKKEVDHLDNHSRANPAITYCTCKLDIFPLYEITTIDGETYLLHPEDRPAIEAFIRGVDPMAELVDELRWNPEINIGRKKRAKEDFEEKVKGV